MVLKENISFYISLLTIWVGLIIKLVGEQDKFLRRQPKKVLLVLILLRCLIFAFNTPDLFLFYYTFEISLLPIFLLILGWGYQPERLFAGLRIIFYTIRASLPFLIIVLYSGNIL